MRSFSWTLLILAIVCTGRIRAEDATLTEVKVVFHTTDDDKDHDTTLSMWIKIDTKTLAYSEGFANNTRFPDKTDSSPFPLGEVDKKISKQEVAKGVKARLKMTTNGDDNWWFKFTVTFKFSDDSTIVMEMTENTKFDDDETTDKTWDLKPK
ncbi:MAG: hypothetical protein KIS92_02315 [Planctomycetota bacterium]|nr:hypothetical protein [Planctomycetota bacterium]